MEIKIAVSSGKKSDRSKFLSALMKKFSGELSDKAISAFTEGDRDALVSAFTDAANSLADEFENS